MSGRSKPHQRPPREGLDLQSFPRTVLEADVVKYRAHSTAHGGAAGAWHFSSGSGGRFHLEAPRGTCYVADSRSAALYELLGEELQDMGGIGIETAVGLMVRPVTVANDSEVANLDDEDAIQFGVMNELSMSAYETYDIPRAWAAAFDAAGFGGIRYLSRHVSGSSNASWAIFGPSGPAPDLPYLEDDARPALDLLREMAVSILGEETSDTLTIQAPPAWK